MESNNTSEEESSASTDYSTDSSDDDGTETAQILGSKIQLPQGLCEKKEIFAEFFAPDLWNSLSEKNQLHLRTFLPAFPENDEIEKTVTLQKLFDFEDFRFNSPLEKFHEDLKAGFYRPDIAKMRGMIRRAERKEARHRYRAYKRQLKNDVIESRQKLLNQIRNAPPGVEFKVRKNDNVEVDLVKHRTKRRYFQVLQSIRAKTDDPGASSDENYFENTCASLSRKQKRHLNAVKNNLDDKNFVSTLSRTSSIDLEQYVTPNHNPFYLNEETYRNLINRHRKRKLDGVSLAEFCTKDIALGDVIERTRLPYFKIVQTPPKNHQVKRKVKREMVRKPNNVIPNRYSSNTESDSDSVVDVATPVPPVLPPKKIKVEAKPKKVEKIEIIEEPPVNTIIKPIANFSQYGKVTPVTISDLEGIDMMNLPIDLDNSDIDILDLNNKPELTQETHSNFLSLLRDIICSTTDHRMDFDSLQKRLKTWQDSPISPLNDWYSITIDWVGLLQSALDFLSGTFVEQPDEFVPYIEFKSHLSTYQWIGAGRDTDTLLRPLFDFWLEHRGDPKTKRERDETEVEISDKSQTPPPPRCPTNWTIRKATQEEMVDFQDQERLRYDNPHKAFTYCCNGYESVVGPLKGIYSPSIGNAKARGHTILTDDRPNFLTILSLVRDAAARLPNGEGTRSDIVELLKCSQYITPNASDSVLQTVVSGALDRMHIQFDPCVKYDQKRKIWIYLHRNRTEEDFEKIHQQYQGKSKNKKVVKKSPTKPKPRTVGDKTKKEPQQNDKPKIVKKSIALQNATAVSSILSSGDTSLLLGTSMTREPSPINMEEIVETSAILQESDEQEINEALKSIMDNRVASPKLVKSTKSLVKIISPSQGKSLILPPNAHPQILKPGRNTPTKQLNQQIVSQQLLQTLAGQKQGTIQIIQKQNDDNVHQVLEQKIKGSIAVPQQIIQGITPQQLQNVKNVTLLRNITQNSQAQSAANSQSNDVAITISASKTGQLDQIPGIQIKSSGNLTPAQQQQIFQTIRQKILPQTVLAGQQQLVLKQKTKQVTNAVSGISLLGQTKLNADVSGTKATLASTQTPMVAKVLTNAAGQVISVESLIAHQKQHGSLPQGTTLRVAGTKGGQPSIIHLTGAASKQNSLTQFAVGSQNNLIALTTQPKLVAASPSSVATTAAKLVPRNLGKTQTVAKIPQKVTQQLINAKIIQNHDGQPKILVGNQNQVKLTTAKTIPIPKQSTNISTGQNSIRMVNAANLNLAQLGGKPILLASKSGSIQNLQSQNVILQAQPNASGQSGLVLQNAIKTIPTANVAQTSINQQNVVLGSQVKVQQSQVVFKNNASVAQGGQGHIVLGGQPVRLQTNASGGAQRLLLASQGQGGQIVAQQILLPAGFQGTAINIKSLQGVKVIPLAQAHGQARGIQRQVFARVVSPTVSTKRPLSPNSTDNSMEASSSGENL